MNQKPETSTCASAVTRLLHEASAGNERASAELLPLVYEQLRALAARQLRTERAGHTLEATALVHEAYLRLVQNATTVEEQKWDGRWHFFSAAAEAMRRILVENARQRLTVKRGGGRQRISLSKVESVEEEASQDLLALDEALCALAAKHPEKAQLVKLRYFGGLSMDEVASAMGISVATAGRHWAYAKAWLYSHISKK